MKKNPVPILEPFKGSRIDTSYFNNVKTKPFLCTCCDKAVRKPVKEFLQLRV